MAARKSCTKLTWAEAKARVGSDSGVSKKKGEKPKKLNHVDKIIAKQTGAIGKDDDKRQRSLRKQAQRQEEKMTALAEKRALERQKQLELPDVYPYEQAMARMNEVAEKLVNAASIEPRAAMSNVNNRDLTDLQIISQSKEMQLSEIMALESIFADTNEYMMCEASRLEELRTRVEEYQLDEESEAVLRSVVDHPPLSLVLQLTLSDERRLVSKDLDLVASILLHVTLPPTYPLVASSSHYLFVDVSYFCCTDRGQQVKADKPLETLAHLEQVKLVEDLQKQCEEMLPDLCIYEVCVTWLSEHIFEYMTLTPTCELLLPGQRI